MFVLILVYGGVQKKALLGEGVGVGLRQEHKFSNIGCFLATVVALDFTLVSKSVGRS